MAIIKKTRDNKYWRVYGEREPCVLLVGLQIGTDTKENSVEFPQINKKSNSHVTNNLPSGYLFKEIQNTNLKKKILMCILMFIVVLFTIAKLWKQPKCPSVDEWIRSGTYIQWNITQT